MEVFFIFLALIEALFFAAGRIINVRYGESLKMRIFLNLCIVFFIVASLIMKFWTLAGILTAVLALFELMPKSWLQSKKAKD